MSVVVSLESDLHQAVQALLPWYALQQLDEDETTLVRQHLQHCAACRAEFEAELSLQALLSTTADAPDAPRSAAALRRLHTRLNVEAPPPARARWMLPALGLQGCTIAVLLVLLWQSHAKPPAVYVGLSAPAVATPANALIMFRPNASELRIREALLKHGAALVNGPTESGAYRLSVTGGARALAALRQEPVVAMAESLDPGTPP